MHFAQTKLSFVLPGEGVPGHTRRRHPQPEHASVHNKGKNRRIGLKKMSNQEIKIKYGKRSKN